MRILTFTEVLNEISDCENHLLIGNGFNHGLGINTGYSNIFKKMLETKVNVYQGAEKTIQACGYDLELFLEKMTESIAEENLFLKKYVYNKIKLDFMQALHDIVKSKIRDIYSEKNEGIYILLNKFNNYFTLNYDPFLYMFLLRHKLSPTRDNDSIAFLPTFEFIKTDLDERHSSIYSEVKKAREHGILQIAVSETDLGRKNKLSDLTKSEFVSAINRLKKNEGKNWTTKEISNVVEKILEEENENKVIEKVDDGSRLKQNPLFGSEFVFDINSETQNLFFLHGAFHIYRDGKYIKKITQDSDRALYDKLEEVLNNDDKEVVCVFQSTNKLETITKNSYLKHCLDKIQMLNGNLVVIGCSLSNNDDHIFKRINDSSVEKVYISFFGNQDHTYETAHEKFPSKEIVLFDAATISYELDKE